MGEPNASEHKMLIGLQEFSCTSQAFLGTTCWVTALNYGPSGCHVIPTCAQVTFMKSTKLTV